MFVIFLFNCFGHCTIFYLYSMLSFSLCLSVSCEFRDPVKLFTIRFLSAYVNKSFCSQLCIFCALVDVMFLFIHNMLCTGLFFFFSIRNIFFVFCDLFIFMSLWLVGFCECILCVCLCLFPHSVSVIKGLQYTQNAQELM